MSNPNHDRPAVPQPLQHEPENLVMNVFPLPGSEIAPDQASQDLMGLYLIQRLEEAEEHRTRFAYEATGRTFPTLARETVGQREELRRHKTDEWLITPRKALLITIGSFAVIQGAANYDTIAGGSEWASHKTYRYFFPLEDTFKAVSHTTVTPGETETIPVQGAAASTDVSGLKVRVDRQAIQSLGDKIRVLKGQGGKIVSVNVIGETSDDWGSKGDAAFGKIDPENTVLGTAIARTASRSLQIPFQEAGLSDAPQTVIEHESLLTPAIKTSLVSEAKADGFSTLESAVKAVDHGQLRKGNLYQKIKTYITSKRGIEVDVTVAVPGKSTTHTTQERVHITAHDDVPNVPGWKWWWLPPLVPVLPMRRREKTLDTVPVKKWGIKRTKEIMKPTLIREQVDQVWLRLDPAAVNEDGTLVENAWAETDKYKHLLRDSRIAQVMRADFKNSEGQDKTMRVVFVDHDPAPETIACFNNLLTQFAAAQDGAVADRARISFVFPSDSAGTEHGDAKLIAVGIDHQHPEHVQGTHTYPLGLTEIHMPTDLEGEELQAELASFYGPAFTMAHETAGGHGSDQKPVRQRLRRVVTSGIPNAYIVEGDPRADTMKVIDNVLLPLPNADETLPPNAPPIQYDIIYQSVDLNGQTVTEPLTRVYAGDPRLRHALQATIVGYQATRYSKASRGEHFADTGASILTGIEIPAEQASETMPDRQTDSGQVANYTRSYRPDVRGQAVFTDAVGAERGSYPAVFHNSPQVTVSMLDPSDDDVIRDAMIRARTSVKLLPEQMISVLARSSLRRRN